jgi:threonine synthase
MVHCVWKYLRVMEKMKIQPGDPSVLVDVVLPTGMGNIAGGCMAKNMGIPLGRIDAAV